MSNTMSDRMPHRVPDGMMEKIVEATNPNAFFKGRASTVTTRKKPSLDIEHTSGPTPAVFASMFRNDSAAAADRSEAAGVPRME